MLCLTQAEKGRAADRRQPLIRPAFRLDQAVTVWLSLAAAPTFGAMALVTGLGGGDMICSSMQGAIPLDGMTTMYLLMGIFHLPAWLRLLSGRSKSRPPVADSA